MFVTVVIVLVASKDFKNLPYHPKYPFDIYDMAKSGMHGSDFIDGAVTENNYAEANSLRDYLLRQKESGQDLRFINKAPVDSRNLQNKDFEFDEAGYKKAIDNSNESWEIPPDAFRCPPPLKCAPENSFVAKEVLETLRKPGGTKNFAVIQGYIPKKMEKKFKEVVKI